MRTFFICAFLFFSNLALALPHLILNFAKRDDQSNVKIVSSAGKIPSAEFAFPVGAFIGMDSNELFSKFGTETAELAAALLVSTLTGPDEERKLTYLNPLDNKLYVAYFIKIIGLDGFSVSVLIYPK